MCGLVGMFSSSMLSRVELNALKELFMLTQLRGTDSTGMVTADLLYKREYNLEKCAGSFLDFTENCPDVLQALRANFVMGHCRYATKGSINSENAHPYAFKKILGMHNGTLTDRRFSPHYYELPKAIRGKHTDSYLFYRELNKVLEAGGKLDDVIKDMEYDSAYAMVYWNYMSTVSLFRNADRPLFIGVEKTNGTVVIASEERYINFISNSKLEFIITKVETDTLYEIDLKQIGGTETPWTTSGLTKQVKPTYTRFSTHWDDYDWDSETGRYVPIGATVASKKDLEDAGQGKLI